MEKNKQEILEKENKELREKVKELEEENHIQKKQIMNIFDNEYITKQKIKDKIEELTNRANRIAGTYQYADSGDDLIEKKKQVIELRIKAEGLQELLQEEDNNAN